MTIRNPFGTMDVPSPDDSEVASYAARVSPGEGDDVNAARWAPPRTPADPIDGSWSSRWNGGTDPTISNDAPNKWKAGKSEVRVVGDRVYLRFDWDGGRRHGLIEARRDGNRLVGKYINLTDPKITRPWVGLIVDATRIDGRHPNGRLDFRR